MPNHCENNMYVKGDNAMLSRFWNDIQTTDKDGNRLVKIASLVPMPDALDGTQSPTPTSPEPPCQRHCGEVRGWAEGYCRDWILQLV